MDESIINSVFQPKSSKQEAKADTTTRIAREILDAEAAKREAKTEKLRQARLLREAAEAEDAPKRAKPAKRTAASK